MSDKETLDKALTALREHGWQRGSLGNEDFGFCMLGALRYAENNDQTWSMDILEAYLSSTGKTALMTAILELHPDLAADEWFSRVLPAQTIARFNDHEAHDFADIEKVFIHAIEQA